MSKRYSGGRPPREYDSGKMGRLFNELWRHINRLTSGQEAADDSLNRVKLQLTQRATSGEDVPVGFVDFFQDAATNEAVGRIFITRGWSELSSFEYRTQLQGNVKNTDGWSAMTQVTDSGLEAGYYYEARVALRTASRDEFNIITMDVRAKNTSGDVFIHGSQAFDMDLLPGIKQARLSVGAFDGTQFPVYLEYTGDEDTLAIDYYYGTSAAPAPITDGDYTGSHDGTYSEGFLVASVDPSAVGGPYDTYYVVVRGRGDTIANGLGAKGTSVVYLTDRIPLDPRDPSLINDDAITANQLVDAAKRASINVALAHRAGFEDTDVSYSGSIAYTDGTSYTLTPGNLATSGAALHYIYFDPTVSATALQITIDAATAKSITGRRILVGLVKAAAAAGDRAFYVVTGDEPVITAPVIYAASLSALTANMGSLTAGQIVITTGGNKIWLNDGDDGVLAVGGATKGSAPFYVAADGSVTATSITLTGYVNTFRQSSDPSAPTAENTGDIWHNTNTADFGGYIARGTYRWNGAAWELSGTEDSVWRSGSDITKIDGGEIYTGSITADAIQAGTITSNEITLTNLSDLTASAGTITSGLISLSGGTKLGDGALGGGTEGLQIGAGTNNWYVSGGNTYFNMGDATNYLHWDSLSGALSMRVGSGTFFNIGNNVNGADTHGIKIDANNYWYVDTAPVTDVAYFAIGDGTQGMTFDTDTGSLVVTGSIIANGSTVIDYGTGNIQNANLTTLTITGTLTFGGGTITGASGGYTSTLAAGTLTVEFGDILSTVQGDEFRLQHQTGAAEALLAFSGTTAGVDRRGYLSLSSDDAGSVTMDAAGLTATASFALAATTGLTLANSSGTYTWPTSAPAADDYVLSSLMDGTMSWVEAGGGDVTKVGTPADNQIGVWTGDGTIEGTTGLMFNSATGAFAVAGAMNATGGSTQLSLVYTGGAQFASMYADNNGRLQLYTSGGAFHPTTNAGQDLGTTSRYWGILYATDAYFGLGGSVSANEIAGVEINGGSGASGGSVIDMKVAGTSRYQVYASDGVLSNQTRMFADWSWYGNGGGTALTLDISAAEFKFSKGIGITGGAAPSTAAGVMKLYADTEDLPKALIGTSGPVGIPVVWYAREDQTAVSTTTPTEVLASGNGTVTMPSGHLMAGQAYHIRAGGDWTAPDANETLTYTLSYDGVAVHSVAVTLAAFTDSAWHADITAAIESTGAGFATINVSGFVWMEDIGMNAFTARKTSLAYSGAGNWSLTMTLSGAAGEDFTIYNGVLTQLR